MEKQLEKSLAIAKEIASNPDKKNFKYRKNPADITFIRGNTKELKSRCHNCAKVFYKNNPWQITYFCSKSCRKDYKSTPVKFEVVQ